MSQRKVTVKTDPTPIFRISILGCCFTGKTQLCNIFCNNKFEVTYEPTNEARIFKKLINLNDLSENFIKEEDEDEMEARWCILEIIDLFGINRQEVLINGGEMNMVLGEIIENKEDNTIEQVSNKAYKEHRQIFGFIFVFDIGNKNSFDQVVEMVRYVTERERKNNKKVGMEAQKILVGNKRDKIKREVREKDIKKVEAEFQIKYQETSALQNLGVVAAFHQIAAAIYDSPLYTPPQEDDILSKGDGSDGFFSGM